MCQLHAAWRAALVTFVVAAVAYAVLDQFNDAFVWQAWLPARCGEYCEASTRCAPTERSVIQQPLNSWSNFAYLFAGLMAWWRRPTPQATLFWLSCAALCLGSFLFHASVTFAFRWVDVAAMYAALVALAVYALSTVVHVRPFSRWIAVALLADVALAAFKWELSSTAVLVVLGSIVVVCMAVTVGRARGVRGYGLAALASLGGGAALRYLDEARVWCEPESAVFQGHAAWHVLTAVTLYCAYRYLDGVDVHNKVRVAGDIGRT